MIVQYSPIQELNHPCFEKHQMSVFIKRDDLIHPIVSGNKWRKLKGNLALAKQLGKTGIVSFGGAYSNHIHALAYACQQEGLKSIAIIRGEPHYQSNYTLTWARHWGMQLEFVNRAEYRLRHDQNYLLEIEQRLPNYFLVPEGGTNEFALSGVSELVTELQQTVDYDTLMLPVGSAGTIAGVINADHEAHNILGIAVLKQADYLNQTVAELIGDNKHSNWKLLTGFHRGGYAKFTEDDCLRLAKFIEQTDVPFEPVYSGKMLLALLDLIEQGYFPAGHRIVLIHTGGLQGVGGLIERNLLPTRYIKAIQSHLPSAPQVR